MARGYTDLATLRTLCQATAGQLHLYAPWSAAHDADQLQNDLRWSAIRPQVRLDDPLITVLPIHTRLCSYDWLYIISLVSSWGC